ncbi:MAG: dihydrolipoamide acetyltransferase family protein [Alphaproteobacteria bacterium]|jgi:pyruvate dehydrogenase E2 component (dihydrolipoamide acetyltransferase)|nr:dihydrolipoamide acetyltransferase family protein [Alphaproteobacteria bacterium]HJP22786.1 dihydrolipoamide acetyltransferase family protein [Alphaproteobacteria bacterium]
MYDFILPDIGEGISEALLISWTVAVGDALEEGAEVATISTDKVDVELPAPRAGSVAELCWKPGDTIPVGEVLMRISDGGTAAVDAEAKAEPKPEPEPVPEAEAESAPKAKLAPVAAPVEAILAAPSTRKLAADRGVDLAGLQGSGRDGMILRRDVEAAAAPAAVLAPLSSPPPAPDDRPEVRREGLNGPRAVAFERLSFSVHTLVHATMTFEVPADALVALLAKLGPEAERRGVKLSYAALFATCVAAALTRHPRFNATIDEERRELLLHRDVNMSIAVATEAGLLVPVVRGLNNLSLFAAAAAINDVAQRGRDSSLGRADMQDGTFTLSNTGNLERTTFLSTRPIINPPQTATLWLSRINDRPRAVDGAFEVGPMVACSLSFDHRFIDGADATRFVNDVAAMIECPEAALAAS